MHKNTAEHSEPTIVGQHKVYMINGTTFEVPTHFSVVKHLGLGAYGVVVSAVDHRTGEKVAIKKCRDVFRDVEDGKRVLREVDLMRFFDHENLLPLITILPPLQGPAFKDVYVVVPLMDVDMNVVLRSRQVLEENHFQYFVYQMLRGLKFLHSAKVAHRDLKPANLVTNISCDLRICDFGLARGLENLDSPLTDYVVTRWYRPPELLLENVQYETSVDIWSVGLIFAELYNRKPLFPGKTTMEEIKMLCSAFGKPPLSMIEQPSVRKTLEAIPDSKPVPLSMLVPKLTNPVGQDFLSKMLVLDPAKRWTAEQLLAHPFLAHLHDPEDEPVRGEIFTWEHEKNVNMTKSQLREAFWKAIVAYNPELQ
jgi:serine/threonine protein kinase